MAKLIKTITTTTGTVFESTGAVITALANSATNTVNGLSDATQNLSLVSTNFTKELAEDSEFNYQKNSAVNAKRIEALNEVLADETMMKKLKEAEKASILEDLFD